jgi:hypothetical protein
MTKTRIYVACLASYNNGVLHGRWVDADQDADDIRSEIAEILRESRSDEQEREEIRLIIQWHDFEGLSFADIADRLEAMRAATENRQPWPRAPYPGSENRRWNASRCHKAFKARKRVPMPLTA